MAPYVFLKTFLITNVHYITLGHDIFRAVGEVAEITDQYPTNQKSACLFLSKHCLWSHRAEFDGGEFDMTASRIAHRRGDYCKGT
jgi:hypothetical protein